MSSAVALQQNSTPSTLSSVQAQVIAALTSGSTMTAAAQSAGVHRSTIYNWIQTQSAFCQALKDAGTAVYGRLRDQLHELSDVALRSIRQLLEDPATPPAVRLRAALAVLGRTESGWVLPDPIPTVNPQLAADAQPARQDSVREEPSRNSLCKCGSGLKYKRCCGVGATPLLNLYRSSTS